MRLSTMGPMMAIRWGRRLVYVLLFIALVVIFGNLDDPRTYLFLGSLFLLTLPILFALRDDKWEETDAGLTKAQRDYQKDIAEWEQHNAQG